MKIIKDVYGLRIIEVSEGELLFEAKCSEIDCLEVFFTTGSYSNGYSCPPFCPSCGKDNTNYASHHDLGDY